MYIVFTLNKQQYAASVHEVQEVIPLPETVIEISVTPPVSPLPSARVLSRIPGADDWIVGVTNLRGRLLPLIDLAVFLGLSERKASVKKWILILELNNIFCGFIVDGVQGIQQFDMGCYKNSMSDSLPKPLHCCIVGSYHNRQEYLVFSFKALVDSHQFLKIAPVATAI